MPCIQYVDFNFKAKSRKLIEQALGILAKYNFPITLRQLYYQFVQLGYIPNTLRDYKKLGSVINDARLAGLIDWTAIEDITRACQSNSHWGSPKEIFNDTVEGYAKDLWADQSRRVEVWIEKDALLSVISRICQPLDVPFFSCRGYTSQTAVWEASQRFEQYIDGGQSVHVIHLGDHDPSGIDMTRDIDERLELFLGPEKYDEVTIDRIGLNMDQIKKYRPPPNPAKVTDSRAKKYIARFGKKSWELDALKPDVLQALIVNRIEKLRDARIWKKSYDAQEKDRRKMKKFVGKFK